jgi:hypothetical protein
MIDLRPVARAFIIVLFASGAGVAAAGAAVGSQGPPALQAPFATPLPWLLSENALEIAVEAGASFHEPVPFGGGASRPDLERRDLTCAIAGGLGDRVEASARFGIQGVHGDAGDEGPVASDVRITVGYAIAGRYDSARSFTARLTAKAPTAPDRAGAGTDEADLGFTLAAGIRSGRLGAFGSAGVELLGNPLRNGAQDDVATYGAGAWIHAGGLWDLTGEIAGRAFSRFGNSVSSIRLGGRAVSRAMRGRVFAIHGAVDRGINENAPRWGVVAGASWLVP